MSKKEILLDFPDFVSKKTGALHSLEHIVKEVREFSKEKLTMRAKKALRELCAGIFESEGDLASNHDFFLYGAPKRK